MSKSSYDADTREASRALLLLMLLLLTPRLCWPRACETQRSSAGGAAAGKGNEDEGCLVATLDPACAAGQRPPSCARARARPPARLSGCKARRVPAPHMVALLRTSPREHWKGWRRGDVGQRVALGARQCPGESAWRTKGVGVQWLLAWPCSAAAGSRES